MPLLVRDRVNARRPARVLRLIARLNVGGPAIHVTELATRLPPNRYEQLLACGVPARDEASMEDLLDGKGIEPARIPGLSGDGRPGLRDLRAFVEIVRLLRRYRPDILHTHTGKAGVLGRIAAKVVGVPIVVHTFHGHVLSGYHGRVVSRALALLERLLARWTTRLVAVSPQIRADLVAFGVAPAGKIEVVLLGLDLDPYLAIDRAAPSPFRQELDVPDGTPLVGIVGRIVPIKNHALFLEAAARLAGDPESPRFVVVGDGPGRAEAEDLSRRLGIADRVAFVGWRRDLVAILAGIDLLVVSSDNEGTPVSAIEAMAAGVPVVATRVGGLPDVIEDGETGALAPPRDPGALAGAIRRLLDSPTEGLRLGARAREAVRTRHAVGRLVADVDALYGKLLSER